MFGENMVTEFGIAILKITRVLFAYTMLFWCQNMIIKTSSGLFFARYKMGVIRQRTFGIPLVLLGKLWGAL